MVQKVAVSPAVCIDHDAKKFTIDVELPGVDKKDIELQMGEQAFCVRGPTKDV